MGAYSPDRPWLRIIRTDRSWDVEHAWLIVEVRQAPPFSGIVLGAFDAVEQISGPELPEGTYDAMAIRLAGGGREALWLGEDESLRQKGFTDVFLREGAPGTVYRGTVGIRFYRWGELARLLEWEESAPPYAVEIVEGAWYDVGRGSFPALGALPAPHRRLLAPQPFHQWSPESQDLAWLIGAAFLAFFFSATFMGYC